MSTKKETKSLSIWLILISGMLTGMGNGSVFGATLMCLMGRGRFANWGGDGWHAYDPSTFDGFVNWSMIVFGFMFCVILYVGLNRHYKLEARAA